MPAESPPPGFYPPDAYAAWWLWVGIGALALVLAWYAGVWWWTRERPVPPVAAPSLNRVERLRAAYLREIDLVVDRAERGVITSRSAHQQLSVLVRHFVQELSGIRAPTMTLTELAGSGPRLTPVSQVVEVLYPGEFAPEAAQTVVGAGEVAREVVRRWS